MVVIQKLTTVNT
ncbi:hypothetical protein FWK35_00003277 [Aphis craccivora]|uniref:Uncharacterized protein n=1 Tax=Aphis craccivora TaxID=307492 RepID=A0A6G0YTG1_APHCR|nr:hypothetical protein FWK35_00027845 [Aphis craccivora]KAF0760958.1 hypothetical protein FWK35_00031812 [Aphis craccivora]KAF0771817.1 hypothetical protein FWK35_00003277 [Aphis craccivora]